ncbi:uncharacterized protein METZ01_LOCUS222212, partial [marine metagenome]
MHQHEAAGAVRVFHHAGARAALAEEGGLLVARDAGDGDGFAKHGCLANDFAGAAHFGQYAAGLLENFQQLRVPIAGAEVV